MPYGGSGANKAPMGKINPILLGQKKDSQSGPPSLLSQHLNRRRETDSSSQEYKDQQSDYRGDGQWNNRQGGYNQQGGYNKQGNYGQQGDYGHGNYNKQGNYNAPSQGYGDQSSNYGDSRRTNNPGPQPLMSIGTQPSQPQYKHGPGPGHQPFNQGQGPGHKPYNQGQGPGQPSYGQGQVPGPNSYSQSQGPGQAPYNQGRGPSQPPYNQGQGFAPVGMNYGMPPAPLPSGAPPGYGPAGFTGPPPGFSGPPLPGPPPPGPPSNSSYNQPPPPPPSFGGPPLPPGGSKFSSEPPAPPLPSSSASDTPSGPSTPPRKRKRRSRWGDVEEKTNIPGMPASLPSNVTQEQKEQYLLHFKIEEISIKLRSGDLGIPANPEDRSPSPEPIYNTEGKRLNTREFRVRKQLEEERHALVQQASDSNPDYKPPIDYRPPSNRIQEKVMIPQDANPAINFIGLLIGPRGNTLKKMEKETSCKIIIRGKGSVKEGKVGRPGFPLPGENEPLHALVTGPTHEDVKNAVKVIEKIIKEGVETPEGSNELRKMQLRELAALNGTLIEEDIARCRNCGATDHRHWECTEVKNVTSQVICTKCGGYGHLAKDCVYESGEGTTTTPQPSVVEKAKMDDEYMSLMAELGVDAPAGASTTVKSTPTPVSSSVQPAVNNQNTLPAKPFSSAPAAPWNAPAPKSLILSGSGPAPYQQKASTAPKPLMDSFVSNGPPSSSSQYKNSPAPTGPQNVAPWSQQGMTPQNGLRGMTPNSSPLPPSGAPTSSAAPPPPRSAAPPPWQAAPAPWQAAQPPFPPASGYGMPPMGVMYPQMGQSGPPIPPWSAPPPPPPPPSN